MVTEHSEVNSEGPMQLPDDDEEDLCRVWDMAMDKVESLFAPCIFCLSVQGCYQFNVFIDFICYLEA